MCIKLFFTELGRLRFLLNRIRYWSKMSNLNFWKCENLRLCLCNTVCYTVCIDLWLKNGSVRGWITKRKNIYINESLFLLLILNRAESEWESTGVVLTDSGWLLSRFANTNKMNRALSFKSETIEFGRKFQEIEHFNAL